MMRSQPAAGPPLPDGAPTDAALPPEPTAQSTPACAQLHLQSSAGLEGPSRQAGYTHRAQPPASRVLGRPEPKSSLHTASPLHLSAASKAGEAGTAALRASAPQRWRRQVSGGIPRPPNFCSHTPCFLLITITPFRVHRGTTQIVQGQCSLNKREWGGYVWRKPNGGLADAMPGSILASASQREGHMHVHIKILSRNTRRRQYLFSFAKNRSPHLGAGRGSRLQRGGAAAPPPRLGAALSWAG